MLIIFSLAQTNLICNKFGDHVLLKVTQAVMFGTKTPSMSSFPPLDGIPPECAVVAIMIVCIQCD